MQQIQRTKQQESAELAEQVRAWLEKGNQIKQVEAWETADKEVMAHASPPRRHFDDPTGQRYGKLVLVRKTKDPSKQNYWLCRCDCGYEEYIEKARLVRGRVDACSRCRLGTTKKTSAFGDIKRKRGVGYDITGKRFGKLVALEVAGHNAHNVRQWLCRCDCGTETKVITTKLIQGLVWSCGHCKT